MNTKQQALEWLELSFKRGYRDGYDEQDPLSRLKCARQFIGPVYDGKDADCLIAVYRLGYSVGADQAADDVVQDAT